MQAAQYTTIPLLNPAWDRDDFYAEADDPDAPDFWSGYPEARTLVLIDEEAV